MSSVNSVFSVLKKSCKMQPVCYNRNEVCDIVHKPAKAGERRVPEMLEEALLVIVGLVKSLAEDLDSAVDRLIGDIVTIEPIEAT